ncbi:unnamed protein product [Lasius platythorax]|uniref:Aldehyde dehydrogenase domain-containing protein n=1 Tax=Lasius platythorax TaxID=488582 RepID=A0AAV2P7N0_9HYME
MLDAEYVRCHETAAHILLTIYNMYQECAVQLFLEDAIIEESLMEWYKGYKKLTPKQIGMMIIFEDSDLHAVINYLKFKRVVSCLNKIWVQKSIIQTFMWYFKKYVGHLDVPIQIFQSKQELLTPITSKCNVDKENVLNIVSIWSEDVIAAKNLARSLNQQVVFINTHMDISPDIVFPYADIFFKSAFLSFNLHTVDEYICTNPINPTAHKGLIYDLFYDGMWQKPKKNTYWIHNNILLANATRKDIIECIESATEGFKNWNTMSNDSRMQILSNFATILECNGHKVVFICVYNHCCAKIMTDLS